MSGPRTLKVFVVAVCDKKKLWMSIPRFEQRMFLFVYCTWEEKV